MQLKWKQICLLAAFSAVFMVAGCASSPQPFEYHDERDQKSGPGLFSGEKGGYVISSEPSEQKTDAEKAPPATD